ncbi:(deoxy)nucleoside triphosphate pyrophosphohydrolase [Thalassoglobus sp.]|uniref:(deoxy)nucleoside triphosphate pyrophosphohydrolase n=1 Tax=Thalassoglobus sp. TaxID=2795869 RepID=UPI003AA96449
MTSIPIGIAIVLSHGRVLVGTRGQTAHLGGQAEFPGGKCETGETAAECAIRECFEETGLKVEIAERLHHEVFKYPDRTVDLTFYLCRLVESAVPHPPALQFEWVELAELPARNFPSGNQAVLRLLTDRFKSESQELL